jgi:hypothetical protein
VPGLRDVKQTLGRQVLDGRAFSGNYARYSVHKNLRETEKMIVVRGGLTIRRNQQSSI